MGGNDFWGGGRVRPWRGHWRPLSGRAEEKPLPFWGRFCLRIAKVLKLECASESSGVGVGGS